MGTLLYVILPAILVGILVFLLIPVSLRFDSRQKYVHVAWLFLSFTKRLCKEKPREPKEKPQKEKKRSIRAVGRFLLKERSLAFELFQKSHRSVIDMLQSASIREMEASFSTPDPMWNGVLSGIFANLDLKNVNVSANFRNINYVRASLQFYPYKVVRVTVGLLIRLPYRRIIKTLLHLKRH